MSRIRWNCIVPIAKFRADRKWGAQMFWSLLNHGRISGLTTSLVAHTQTNQYANKRGAPTAASWTYIVTYMLQTWPRYGANGAHSKIRLSIAYISFSFFHLSHCIVFKDIYFLARIPTHGTLVHLCFISRRSKKAWVNGRPDRERETDPDWVSSHKTVKKGRTKIPWVPDRYVLDR